MEAAGSEATKTALMIAHVPGEFVRGNLAGPLRTHHCKARATGSAPTCFIRGRHLLNAENEERVDRIERSMRINETLVPDGLNALLRRHAHHGMRGE